MDVDAEHAGWRLRVQRAQLAAREVDVLAGQAHSSLTRSRASVSVAMTGR